MLFNSVILILREVLEAAILVSILLALSRNLGLGVRWLWWALPVAVIGTVAFASSLDVITDALDGAGQEVANASLQLLVYLLTVGILALLGRGDAVRPALAVLMGGTVICALAREGSEMLIYIRGFASVVELRGAVFTGSAIGAGIGLSMGVLLYSALRAFNAKRACIVLLCFIGAGMVMQATMLLEQVDWLPAGRPVWDTSSLVAEQSITGELLYAVFGYEATPSLIQVALYCASLLLMVVVYYANVKTRGPEHLNEH